MHWPSRASRWSNPRLPTGVDGDCRAGCERKLGAMGLAAKDIGHIPVRDLSAARDARTVLHILGIGLRAAVDVRAHRGTGDGTNRRRHVVAAAAADLMPDH